MLTQTLKIISSMRRYIIKALALTFRCFARIQILMILKLVITKTFCLWSNHFALGIFIIDPAQIKSIFTFLRDRKQPVLFIIVNIQIFKQFKIISLFYHFFSVRKSYFFRICLLKEFRIINLIIVMNMNMNTNTFLDNQQKYKVSQFQQQKFRTQVLLNSFIMQINYLKANPIIEQIKKQRQSQKNLLSKKSLNSQKANQQLCAIYLSKKSSTRNLYQKDNKKNIKQKKSISRSKLSQNSNTGKTCVTPRGKSNKIKNQFTKQESKQNLYKRSISNVVSNHNSVKQLGFGKSDLKKSQFYYQNNNKFLDPSTSHLIEKQNGIQMDRNSLVNKIYPITHQNQALSHISASKIQTVPFRYTKLQNYSSYSNLYPSNPDFIPNHSSYNSSHSHNQIQPNYPHYQQPKHSSTPSPICIDHIKQIRELQKQNKTQAQLIQKLRVNINQKDVLLSECQKQIYHIKHTYEMILNMVEVNKAKEIELLKGDIQKLEEKWELRQQQNSDNKQKVTINNKTNFKKKKQSKVNQQALINDQKSYIQSVKNIEPQNQQSIKYIKNVDTQQVQQEQQQQQSFRIQYSNSINQQQSIVDNQFQYKLLPIQIQQSSFQITDSSKDSNSCTSNYNYNNTQSQNYLNQKPTSSNHPNTKPSNFYKTKETKKKKPSQNHNQSDSSKLISNQDQQMILKTKNQIASTRKDIEVLKERINSVMEKHNRVQVISNLSNKKGQKSQKQTAVQVITNSINTKSNDKQNNLTVQTKKVHQTSNTGNTGSIVKNIQIPSLNNSTSQSVITPIHRLTKLKVNNQ